MKLLVTGASGFIGLNFLKSLPREWEVTAVTHRNRISDSFLHANALEQVNVIRVPLDSQEAVQEAFQGKHFDQCLFLAANGDPTASTSRPVWDLHSNSVSLLNLCQSASIERLLFMSSGAVYDGLQGAVSPKSALSPALPYAISKLASEHYLAFLKKKGFLNHFLAVRFFGAYGPYEAERKIYNRLIRKFVFEKDPHTTIRGDGKNLIDAMYVDDTIRALHAMLSGDVWDLTLDLCSGNPKTLLDLVKEVGALCQMEPTIQLEGEVPEYIQFFSTDDQVKRLIHFAPEISLAEGVQRFLKHMELER